MVQARSFRWFQAALAVALTCLVSAAVRGSDREAVPDRPLAAQPAALVAWPPSAGLVVAEVVTGAGSASDEFVEIYNASALERDLGGLELVYVTSSGSTVSKKQTWTQLILGPHRHLLIANAAGKWAAGADGHYSSGFAATGGSLVLRTLSGSVIDSLSWGDATNSFVEGAAGPAPAAGSSLERRPGGSSGNGIDTNDNLADTRIEASPLAQGIASDPVPAATGSPQATPTGTASLPTDPTATPTATPTAPCTPEPSVTLSPDPTSEPSPSPTPSTAPTDNPTPVASATPTASAVPSASPTATTGPSATLNQTATPATDFPTPGETPTPSPSQTPPATETATPSPTATATATPSPTATATPTVAPQLDLQAVRALPLGTIVAVHGRLTASAGLIDSNAIAYIDDGSAGIALRLATGVWDPIPAGTDVDAVGVLEARDGLLVVTIDGPADVDLVGVGPISDPLLVATGLACAPFEARLLVVEGWVTGAAVETGSGGHAATVDDGTGPLAVIADPGTGVLVSELALGARVRLTGVLGQHDPTGTDVGYRLYLRSLDDVLVLNPPPTPTPSPTTTPTPTASPKPSPSPSPVPTEAPLAIAEARGRAIGSQVVVRGVVTVGAGWILGDSTVAIQDGSGGIFVRLPDPAIGQIVPGRMLEVRGALADPYANLEIRPATGGVQLLGIVPMPTPRPLDAAGLGEATEGVIARLTATIKRIEVSSTGSLTLIVEDSSGEGRIFAHAPLGLQRDDYSVGDRVTAIGLVGDRLGLYRLWPRNKFDIAVAPTASPTPSRPGTPTPTPTRTPAPTATNRPTPTPSSTPSDVPARVVSIAEAVRANGQEVTVDGAVTTRPGLLDADGVRVTIQDATGAILVRLPSDVSAQVGQRIRVTGEIGTYYGAPQLTAGAATRSGEASVEPLTVRAAPLGQSLEWRLVSITGTVASVHRDGDAWRAELNLSGGSVPVVGLARSGIASTAIVSGRTATVTGIVKRAYPTASDQRFAIVPRSAADIRLGAAGDDGPDASASPGSTFGPGPDGSPHGSAPPSVGAGGPSAPPSDTTVVALADLAAHEGSRVHVGGVVTRIEGTRLTIEDGSGAAVVRLVGEASSLASDVANGDVLNARGIVERNAAGGLEVAVDDPLAVEWLAPVLALDTRAPSPQAVSSAEAVADGQAPASTSFGPAALVALAVMALAICLFAAAFLASPASRNRVRQVVADVANGLKSRLAQLRSG